MNSQEIWEQVKKNHASLEKCKRHFFDIDLNPEMKMGKRWKCSNRGGEVGSTEKLWYERGLEHKQRKGGVEINE